jgi:hypothetical protein
MRESAPTKSTGGGGYTFADKVAAGFLVRMLNRSLPIEPERGPIVAVHFETRDAGQILDDLSLDLVHGTHKTRCVISVKSNRQLTTTSGFNTEFVEDAWEQWRRPLSSQFDPNTDLLGLVVGSISTSARHEWQKLSAQAANTTPDRIVARLANPGQISAEQKAIFASLHDPDQPDELETARLLSRIRVFPFSADDEGTYINLCVQIVRAGTLEEGRKLWDRLLALAAESRAMGGFHDLAKLVYALRPDFELRDYPDYEADWKRIEGVSKENADGVGKTIGGQIELARTVEKATLSGALAQNNIVVLTGESGSGKSSVVAGVLENPAACKRLLWLSAEQLSKSSQTEIAHAFHLQHSLTVLIHNTTARDCVLVLDRFEKLEGEARRRALELIGALKSQAFLGWTLVITCQDQFAKTVQDALIEAGISESHRIPFDKPTRQDIYDALPHLPQIRMLLSRSQLVPLLRNLMVLDWVLRAEIGKHLSEEPTAWIGETDLINWIWDRWIGTSSSNIARDALLRALGRHEGERLSGAVHVDTIKDDHQDLNLLGELADESLLRVKLPSIRFYHDLMGDWARFRDISYAADPVAKIKEFASIPRWVRAIHLYAQSLAEKQDDSQAWRTISEQLSGDEPIAQVASDIFLDGLLFATNSEVLLEQMWPSVMAGGGLILKRLLKRLQYSASVPDPRASLLEPQMAALLEGHMRIPHPTYWTPALAVFDRHADDVVKTALLPAAEACAFYLRAIPAGLPGRVEAGRLAIQLAKELQGQIAQGRHFRNADKPVYEALLSAATEFSDEVAQIALELCGRRDEPRHAILRSIEANEKREQREREWLAKNPEPKRPKRYPPISLSESRGPLRAQAADGPREEVSEGFRSAVLDTAALTALITARPEAAREVLLAVCIKEPRPTEIYRDRFSFREDWGLAHWRDGYPAAYWKGAFLSLLQKAPIQGLEAILRLVNYATNRSLEGHLGHPPTEEDRRKYGWEFELDGETRTWLGNANTFSWYRATSLDAPAVESALMALEKWLYDEIDSGHSVSVPLTMILAHAESLAFAGVLVSVGLRHPLLLTKELRPLLGNLFLYQLQLSLALGETGNVWAIAYSNQLEPIIRLAREWNQMPHRRYALRYLAPQLMFQNSGTREYMASRISAWKKLLSEHPSDTLELLIRQLDPASYKEIPQPDGTIHFELQVPIDLESKLQPARTQTDFKTLSLALGIRARQYLSNDPLPKADVAAFATELERLAQWQPPEDDPQTRRYRFNSIAGGVAVVVIQHPEWLSENSKLRDWCLDFLRNPNTSEGTEFDSPVSGLDHTAEAFRAEAGLALLEESREEWILHLVFDGITDFYYKTILQTMLNAFFRRSRLGETFNELVNIVILWSALRRAADRDAGYQASRAFLEKYKTTLFRRLVAGRLRGEPIPFRSAQLLAGRLVERISRRTMSESEKRMRQARQESLQEQDRDRKLRRETSHLDTEVLRKGFGFLPLMITEPISQDHERLARYIQQLFELEMRTLPRPASDQDYAEIEGTPFDFDRWILSRVAEFIARSCSKEAARNYYRPILDLGPAGRYWVEDFLQAWVSRGLVVSTDRAAFSVVWTDMVEYTLLLPAWRPRAGFSWSPAEPLAVDLMGLRDMQTAVLGQAEYNSVVTAMRPMFERWAKEWLGFESVAAWFCRFLVTESGRILLPWGLTQLADRLSSFEQREFQQHHLGDFLTDVLDASWKHLRNNIENQPPLRAAFLRILTDLCAKQVPGALQLRSKVSEILTT